MSQMINVDFENCFIFTLLCFLSFLCYSLFFKKPKESQAGYEPPPSPPSIPIIGHLHLILSPLPHKAFQKLSSKYGSILSLRVFNVPLVLVSSASIAYELFRVHDLNISSHGDAAFDESLFFGACGIALAPYGDYWKFMRKLVVTKVLGPQALDRLRGVRVAEVEKFHANLLDKAMKNESVEIGKEAIKLTNTSICRMIMGRSCLDEAQRIRELVVESFALLKKYLVSKLLRRPLEKFGISLFKKELMSLSSRFDELLEKILVEHEEKLEYRHEDMDMMDMLLTAYRDEKAEYKITRHNIKSLFVDLLLGGTDTSAQEIEWTMAEIINNPHIMDKLRGEIDSVVGKTRMIQETDLPNLPYLQAVVKEGLRLHPQAPILVRTVSEGCNVGGFYIPKNTTLVVNSYDVMRDPDSWEDPEEFKPERFLGEDEEMKEKTLKFLPFGSGRRGCPGVNLAYIFVGTAIGVMVQCFDWRINGDKVNMEEAAPGMTLDMAHPLTCTPVVRNQSLTSTRVKSHA